MSIARGITIEEFERLTDSLAHYKELVDGQLVDVSGNTLGHNRLRDLVLWRLAPLVEPKLGRIICEQDFAFDGNLVLSQHRRFTFSTASGESNALSRTSSSKSFPKATASRS
jgi:hypothetical protein